MDIATEIQIRLDSITVALSFQFCRFTHSIYDRDHGHLKAYHRRQRRPLHRPFSTLEIIIIAYHVIKKLEVNNYGNDWLASEWRVNEETKKNLLFLERQSTSLLDDVMMMINKKNKNNRKKSNKWRKNEWVRSKEGKKKKTKIKSGSRNYISQHNFNFVSYKLKVIRWRARRKGKDLCMRLITIMLCCISSMTTCDATRPTRARRSEREDSIGQFGAELELAVHFKCKRLGLVGRMMMQYHLWQNSQDYGLVRQLWRLNYTSKYGRDGNLMSEESAG